MPAQLQYGPILIDINRVRCQRKSVRDGPNYIYTHHIYIVQGVYNPAATAYVRANGAPVLPPANQNVLAPQTDVSIRDTLMVPRQQLTYKVGPNVVMQSPWAIALTKDENNGPNPIACDVTSIHGSKTFLVEFAIETFVNEKRLRAGPVKAADVILSNTFAQEDDLDEHFYLTRTTRGKAVLSTAVLQGIQKGLYTSPNLTSAADTFRLGLLQQIPVPTNCQRENIRCVVDENNNTLTYAFTDRERSVNILFENIPEIRATQTRTVKELSTVEQYKNFLTSPLAWLRAGWETAKGAFSGRLFIPSLIGGISVGNATATDNIPTIHDLFDIEVFGNAIATKKEMLDAAKKILALQLRRSLQANVAFLGQANTTTAFDLIGKHLHLTMSIQLSKVTQFLQILAGKIPTNVPTDDVFGEADVPPNSVFTNRPIANPVPPGDGVSRGRVTAPMTTAGAV